VTTIGRPTPTQVVLELQARARDHALAERLERLERSLARVHARIDGAMVTSVPEAEAAAARRAPSPNPP
jgi:BMFP domain-containing protein YqiC